MRLRLQLAGCLLVMGLSAVLAGPSAAQSGRAWAQQQQQRPLRSQDPGSGRQQPRQQPRDPARGTQQNGRPNGGASNPHGNKANRPDYAPRPNANPNRRDYVPPRNGNPNRPGYAPRPNTNPNRQPYAYAPPQPRQKFNDLTPQEKQRVIENYNRLNRLPPAQRQELQGRIETWNRLTPQQKNHIRNDVLPKWQQMPQERRQAIQQRLRLMQNMPDFARNQRLNDPEFTRGMSEEDRATLRDLSHLHVGGAPDPPGE